METSSIEQTQLEKPYTFFLFKGIMGIYEAWDEGDVELALRRACRLVVFLPTDIKEILWPKKEEIQKQFTNASRVTGIDFYTTQLNRNRLSVRVALHYLEPFVDEMVRLLDEKQWLERGSLRPRFPGSKKLSVESIESR